MDLHSRLAWRMLSASDRNYALSLAEFTKRQRRLRLDAFEHYIRGLSASEDDARLRELREAARLEPDWPEPDFALGEVYFARRDCDGALPWYARVPKTHGRYVEAMFATGVCRLLLGQPDRAEEVFTSLQEALKSNMVSGADLPEILNDLAIARARQGKTAAAQTDLRRAADLDRIWIPRKTIIHSILACWRSRPMMQPRRRIISVKLRNASQIVRRTGRF